MSALVSVIDHDGDVDRFDVGLCMDVDRDGDLDGIDFLGISIFMWSIVVPILFAVLWYRSHLHSRMSERIARQSLEIALRSVEVNAAEVKARAAAEEMFRQHSNECA